MTYETYHLIFVVAAALSGVFLVISAILFVALRIPKVVGDLSGATAKKAIQSIREQNEQSGNKVYKSSKVNIERGKLTEKISPSGRLVQHPTTGFGARTEKISTQFLQNQALQNGMAGETEVLGPTAETTVLNMEISETTVLMQNTTMQSFFEIEQDITFIHTDEQVMR